MVAVVIASIPHAKRHPWSMWSLHTQVLMLLYPVIPWCCCLEIHTARASFTPGHYGGINMGMDQTPGGEAAESSLGSQSCVSKVSLLHPVSLCHSLVSQVCSFSFISNPKPAVQCWVRNQPDKTRSGNPRRPFREQTQIISH